MMSEPRADADVPRKATKSLYEKEWKKHVKYEHLVAGLSGGVVATLILHPFDLIKIRFQVNDGQTASRPVYTGVVNGFRTVVQADGVRGLYQGVTPNVWGAGSAWGLYFFGFNSLKTWIQEIKGVQVLGAKEHLLAGMIAGCGTLSVTNPIWVVKTRMCLQYSSSVDALKKEHYTGVIDGLIKLYRHEGIQGLYKGFVPGLLGVSHGAFQFMAYEELKKWHSSYTGKPIKEKLGPAEYVTMAALSKIFAVSVTYPYQVVRSRLQDAQSAAKYDGIIDLIKKVSQNEGFCGFYKGITPSILRVTPACCITFLVYENLIHFLLHSKQDQLEKR